MMTPKRTTRSPIQSEVINKKPRSSKSIIAAGSTQRFPTHATPDRSSIIHAPSEHSPLDRLNDFAGSQEDSSSLTDEDENNKPETRPTHTSEIGTLRKLADHNGTAWLGSSSGVYFVNTVRRAFSAAFQDTKPGSTNDGRVDEEQTVPPSEDILTGDNEDGRNYNGPTTSARSPVIEDPTSFITRALGKVPVDKAVTMELVTSFFRSWHPLFPFLHGPQFLRDVELIYARLDLKTARGGDVISTSKATALSPTKLATLQIIINIASLDHPDVDLPSDSRIRSASDVTRIAGLLAIKHDTEVIQACLASELYLVATICLRQASTVAGMVLKLIYHAGLHRCPLRYAQLTLEDCEIRKRIFWSAYALDRYLSLSLGDPNTVQDSDIDVCLSGKELHKGISPENFTNPSDVIQAHLPMQAHPSTSTGPISNRIVEKHDNPLAQKKQLRESAMTAYVQYGRLTGRIVELFHKSIHARFPKHDAIVYLETDVENWWNQLPNSLTSEESSSGMSYTTEDLTLHHRQLAPFFTIMNQHMHLLMNRPKLSLDQSGADFQHGLQRCIKASRITLTALKQHVERGQSMLLPGLFSATWMAGLIIAFACQLGKYPKARACSEISICLQILESRKWFTVRNCHKVLSLLLHNIKARRASSDGFLSAKRTSAIGKRALADSNSSSRKHVKANINMPSSLSLEVGRTEVDTSSQPEYRQSLSEVRNSQTSGGRAVPLRGDGSSDGWRDGSESIEDFNVRATIHPSSPPDLQNSAVFTPGIVTETAGGFGAALYTDPQDAEWAEWNHNIDLEQRDNVDPQAEEAMIWDNLDYSIPDIFSAASWEQMTGAGGLLNNAVPTSVSSDWSSEIP